MKINFSIVNNALDDLYLELKSEAKNCMDLKQNFVGGTEERFYQGKEEAYLKATERVKLLKEQLEPF